MEQQILDKNGFEGQKAWAFGLGLERLAMVLFSIPDIRLFWTEDQRFLKQFKAGSLGAKFKPYSKFPPCFKVRLSLAAMLARSSCSFSRFMLNDPPQRAMLCHFWYPSCYFTPVASSQQLRHMQGPCSRVLAGDPRERPGSSLQHFPRSECRASLHLILQLKAGVVCPVQDVSFWLPEDGFTENNLCEVVRGIAGDLVESVQLIDNFTNPKKQKTSHCYRIAYRSMDRSLTDEEINDLQNAVRDSLTDDLKVELR